MFDRDQYDRIINNVVNSITIIDDNINMIDKLALYYASLIYPADSFGFYTMGNMNGREILEDIKFPSVINNKSAFINLIIDNINNNDILSDCILLDKTHPKTIAQTAINMKYNGTPLYTKYTVFIKNKSKLFSLCFRSEKHNCFMEYLYHTGLFLSDNITTKNKYIVDTKEIHKKHIINLILLFGNNKDITMDDIV